MAKHVNTSSVSGILSADPELKHTAGGKAYTKLRIGIPDEYKNQQTGEKQTTWINVNITFWDKAAEIICEYGRKGEQILIWNSRLKSNQWEDKDGKKRESLELNGGEFVFINRKGEAGQRQPVAKQERQEPAEVGAHSGFSQDEVPF